ncbi:hypothetical protein PAMA_006668 [Pampus argenteus]
MQYVNTGSSSDICVIVGSSSEILTVEESEVHEQPATSSYSGLDAIPGGVPDNEPSPATSPVSTVTVNGTEVYNEAESIENVVDELVQTIRGGDQESAESVTSDQEAACSRKLKELTDRLFNLVVSGQDYQIPQLPDGMRMCDIVTYRKTRRCYGINPDVIIQALYMRTEELVSRCVVQAVMWRTIDRPGSEFVSTYDSCLKLDSGTYCETVDSGPPFGCIANSTISNTPTIIKRVTISNTPESTQSKLLTYIMHKIQLNLLVGSILTSLDIVNDNKVLELTDKIVEDFDLKLYDYFQTTIMGKTHKDFGKIIINDLLLEFGSVEELQEKVRAEDPKFEEALKRALMKQLRFPTTKTMSCSFFKKCKRLWCKKKSEKDRKTQTVRSPTCDEDKGKYQEYLNEAEQPQCLPKSTIASFSRRMCSSLRKTFFSVVKTLRRPFMACCSRKNQVSVIMDGSLDL